MHTMVLRVNLHVSRQQSVEVGPSRRMSVDYNELYQEFLLLTSSPSVSSSSPAPSPSPPLRRSHSSSTPNHCPASKTAMNSVHRLAESGSPTDQSLSPHMSSCGPTSAVPPPPSSFSNHHSQYMWSQQQLQHFGEKRKDVSPNSPSPCSPTEPPTKKQAFKDADGNNNGSLCGDMSKANSAVHDSATTQLPVPVTSGCIVNNITSLAQDNTNTAHFPRVSQILAEEEQGTSCIIIHKQGPPLNELRRLLTTPLGQGPRGSSYTETPQSSSYMQHSSNYLSTYTTPTNGTHLHSLSPGNQECWLQHQSQNQMHQQTLPGPNAIQQNMCIVQQPTGEAIEEVVKFNPWLASIEAPVFPGGLEVLWKEVPEECQKLITPQDVPDSARFRGYFTVCELLTLKRNLKSRYNSPGGLPPMRMPPPSASAVVAAAAAAQAAEIMNAGVGVAVKEALDVLEEDEQQQSPNSNGSGTDVNQQSIPNSSIIQQPEGNHAAGNDSKMYLNVTPEIKHVVPPPPYRTSTLVLKLLQIGNYSFRSFSENNPNRLKVLYNSQRLMYECHLPSVQNRDSSQFQRRILTIDVCFDQIVDIKFGCDKMTLQVDGTPVFTVSHNLANEVPHTLTLTPHDQNLLEQIDKGLLKLTPVHQLYFINERLVHNLESQLREHPRFRHLLTQNQMSLHGR